MSWSDKNNGIGSEPANGLVYRRASKTGRILQILGCKVLTGFQPTTNNQILNLLISEIEKSHPVVPAIRRLGVLPG
jgi:hypothetical protein